MVLLHKKQRIGTPQATGNERASSTRCNDLAAEVSSLNDCDEHKRRIAARNLASFAEAADVLIQRLGVEVQPAVRQAIFDALLMMQGDKVVDGLIPLLLSEDAALRNGVIEVLQEFPDEMAGRIASLLNHANADTRIFAIDILQLLAHPNAPMWLLGVIRDEEHVNVVGAAVDRLVELADKSMLADLEALKKRFSNQAYICFAVDLCLQRIGEEL